MNATHICSFPGVAALEQAPLTARHLFLSEGSYYLVEADCSESASNLKPIKVEKLEPREVALGSALERHLDPARARMSRIVDLRADPKRPAPPEKWLLSQQFGHGNWPLEKKSDGKLYLADLEILLIPTRDIRAGSTGAKSHQLGLSDGSFVLLNAVVLDHLAADHNLIPTDWLGLQKSIYFSGTEFQLKENGALCIPCLITEDRSVRSDANRSGGISFAAGLQACVECH